MFERYAVVPRLWYASMKTNRLLATTFGLLALYSEDRYWKAIKK